MKVAILRPKEYIDETISKFKREGFDVVGIPFIKLVISGLEASKLDSFDVLVITSQTSAKILVEGIDASLLKGKKIIAIGKKTAEVLRKYGIEVELPTKFDSETLYAEYKDELKGLKVVALRSDKGSSVLLNLSKICDFEEMKLYSIEFEHGKKQEEFVKEVFKNNNSYAIVFSSSMIARSFVELSKKLGFDVQNLNQLCVAIGPPTKAFLEKHSINALMPAEYTFDGIVELLKSKVL